MALSLFGNSIMNDGFFGSSLGWGLPVQFRRQESMIDRSIFRSLGAVDVNETEEEYRVTMDTPGLDVNDIKVEVHDGNLLTISGERNSEVEDDGSNYYERSFGRFSRSFRLLNNADSNNLSASMNRGVLSVRIPKISPDPPSVRQINIENREENISS